MYRCRRGPQGAIIIPQALGSFGDRAENLGDILNVMLAKGSAAQVDVVGEWLDDEHIDEDGSGEADVGSGDGKADAWTMRDVAYHVILREQLGQR